MQRVNGHYLYQVGYQIHPLSEFKYHTKNQIGTTNGDAIIPLIIAEGAIEPLLTRSIFLLRLSQQAGQELLKAIKDASESAANGDSSAPLDSTHVYAVTSALTKFEAILGAELALVPLYVVTQKSGFDTVILTEGGDLCFPTEISLKVPEAVPDLKEGARCLAFELFNASGFHFHRANEVVLHRYWDVVTNGKERPKSRNMADFINGMNTIGVGDSKVKSALKDLKDLHRNPLIHAGDSIGDLNKAVSLMNSIHSTITYMLAEIPDKAV